ncbi:hypothetical protein C4571_00805 [Candidatus Parcubacteria bacterium]|nr:MAG: hypothetical protein C4571_00805 [Candidatus Parcubacteria bacterium]
MNKVRLIVVLVATILALTVGYFLWPSADEVGPPLVRLPTTDPFAAPGASPDNGTGGQLPAPESFGLVAENSVANFFVNPDNSIFLVQPDGQVAEVREGKSTVLSSSLIANLRKAIFSYDGKMLLVLFGEKNSPQASVFEIGTRSWSPIAIYPEDAVWSPSTHELAYLTEKGGVATVSLLLVGDQKAKPRDLLTLHAFDLTLQWPQSQQIFLLEKGSSVSQASAWKLDVKTKEFVPVVLDKVGFQSAWSGDLGLVLSGNETGRGGTLVLSDNKGTVLRELNFLTLPIKCTFSGSSVQAATGTIPTAGYLDCATPRGEKAFRLNPIPDAYERMALFTTDDFYRINLNDGTISAILTDSSRDVDGFMLRAVNGRLFFVNRYDQKLYTALLP